MFGCGAWHHLQQSILLGLILDASRSESAVSMGVAGTDTEQAKGVGF